MIEQEPNLTFDCQLWKITRRDGVIFGYTSHDEDIIYEGVTYLAKESLNASAIETGAYIDAPGDMELDGIISDDRVKESDLFGGLFDGATVLIIRYYWLGNSTPLVLTGGVISTVTQQDQQFVLALQTVRARLDQQALLEVYSASCRFTLGDARCTVDLTPFTRTGAVTAITEPDVYESSARRIFVDTARDEASLYWALGIITWTSGANVGLSSEIKDFGSATFVLWSPMPYAIEVGDEYRVTPGCDRLKTTCITKFDNLINFGGFPDVPGPDALIQSPDAKG